MSDEIADNCSHCIDITSNDGSDDNDHNDDTELRYVLPIDRYFGEDFCEKANIIRNSDAITDDYNDIYIDQMLSKLRTTDSKIEDMYECIETICIDDSDSEPEIVDCIDHSSQTHSNKWTPNVILPPNDLQDYNYGAQTYYCLDPIGVKIDSCLRYSSNDKLVVPLPFESLKKTNGFHATFLNGLVELECQPRNIQFHVWPCILKGYSLTCISGPKSGKTNAYLIPLLNWFDSDEVDNSDVELGSVVVCNSTRKTLHIALEAKKWIKRSIKGDSKVRIIVLNRHNQNVQKTAILNGCDILITTPLPLIHLINSQVVSMKHVRSLIIDDADLSLAFHRKTIMDIILSTIKMKKLEEIKLGDANIKADSDYYRLFAFQTLVFAEKWTKDVEWFCNEVQHNPMLIISSYYEASIAFNVKCKVLFCANEGDRDSVLKSALKQTNHKECVAIVCKSYDEINFLKVKLKIKPLIVTEETHHYNLENINRRWDANNSLFITDNAVQLLHTFDSSKCIIHYKISDDFNKLFGERFRLMKNYFKNNNLLSRNSNVDSELINYILVSSEDIIGSSHLVTYIKRVGQPIPKSVKDLFDKTFLKHCSYFCRFGRCVLKQDSCVLRHAFDARDTPNISLPYNGQIKIVITFVLSTNEFYIRINEFRNETHIDGKWQPMNVTFADIKQKLNELRDKPFNTLKKLNIGCVYGITVRNDVLRVRLIEIIGDEDVHHYQQYDPIDASKIVLLYCIDYGHQFRSRSRQLFNLSDELKSFPSLAYKAYLFGLIPFDNEFEWEPNSTRAFYEMVDNFRVKYITAWILKQIDGVFWLNKLKVKQSLMNVDNEVYCDPLRNLIERKLVDVNSYKLTNFNDDYNKIVAIWNNDKLIKSVINSSLSDSLTYVVITDFYSLNEIYIMHENRVKSLECFENNLSKLSALTPLKNASVDQLCLCKIDINSINRAKIVSIDTNETCTVYFVDHGEIAANIPLSHLFVLNQTHIKQMPFQAIKVKLIGIKQLIPINHDLICDLTRNEENDYLMVIAKKIDFKDNIYSVKLYVASSQSETEFISLSKLLVDGGYAAYVDNEQNEEHILTYKDSISDDEVEDEYKCLEERMKSNMCDKLIMQHLGIESFEQLNNETLVNQTQPETRLSKINKQLKLMKRSKLRNELNICEDIDSDDELKSYSKPDYKPGDFDYKPEDILPGLSFFDPNDVLDNEPQNVESDEDAYFEDEDELISMQ